MNRILVRLITKKTPYDLFKGREPNVGYFHLFKRKCFTIINEKEEIGKFDVFLEYTIRGPY